MKHNDFTNSVLRTARLELSKDHQLNNILFGLAGETGEVIDCYKKQLFQDHPVNLDKIKNEVGDVLYYLFWLAHHQGFTIEECMLKNKEKLEKRYPVSFSGDQSIYRMDE